MIVAYHFSFSYCRYHIDYNIYYKIFSQVLKRRFNIYSKVSHGYLQLDIAPVLEFEWHEFTKNLWCTDAWMRCFIADPAMETKAPTYVLLFHNLERDVATRLHRMLAKNPGGYFGALIVDPVHRVQNQLYLRGLDPRFLVVGRSIYILHDFMFDLDQRLQLTLWKSGFDSVIDAVIHPSADDLRFLLGAE